MYSHIWPPQGNHLKECFVKFPQWYESDKFNFCSATFNERRKLQLPAKFWPSDLTPSSRKNAQTERSGTLGKNQSYVSSMNLDKPKKKKSRETPYSLSYPLNRKILKVGSYEATWWNFSCYKGKKRIIHKNQKKQVVPWQAIDTRLFQVNCTTPQGRGSLFQFWF